MLAFWSNGWVEDIGSGLLFFLVGGPLARREWKRHKARAAETHRLVTEIHRLAPWTPNEGDDDGQEQ